jgi:hypothetical protein
MNFLSKQGSIVSGLYEKWCGASNFSFQVEAVCRARTLRGKVCPDYTPCHRQVSTLGGSMSTSVRSITLRSLAPVKGESDGQGLGM